MDEKVVNILLERLNRIETKQDRVLDELRMIKSEIVAKRHYQRGLELTRDVDHDDIAAIKTRLDRIERRLELTDE